MKAIDMTKKYNSYEDEYPVGIGASLAEVRQTIIEAKEHEDDPNYWITWDEIDEEFRNRYPGWK